MRIGLPSGQLIPSNLSARLKLPMDVVHNWKGSRLLFIHRELLPFRGWFHVISNWGVHVCFLSFEFSTIIRGIVIHQGASL